MSYNPARYTGRLCALAQSEIRELKCRDKIRARARLLVVCDLLAELSVSHDLVAGGFLLLLIITLYSPPR